MLETLSILFMLASLESRILDCAGIAADAERLRCFDAVGRLVVGAAPAEKPAAAPAEPVATQPPVVSPAAAAPPLQGSPSSPANAPQESVGAGAERDFGLTDIQLEERDGPREADEVGEIESLIAEVLPSRAGKHAYRLENGQLWRQIESTSLPPMRAGEIMVVRRAMFGSFLASGRESGRPPVRVRRQE